MAREWDEKFERGEEMEGLTPVNIRVNRKADIIYSMRFTQEEIALLRQRAAEQGVKLSEYVRAVLMEVAQRGNTKADDRMVVRLQVQKQVQDLEEMVRRL